MNGTGAVWGRPAPLPPASPPPSLDVLVIGGGITGLSLLHWLWRRGVKAAVVERMGVAAGASGRNAGFLLTGVADNYAVACRTHGRALARELWDFTAGNHDLLLDLLGGAEVGHRRNGALTLAGVAGELEELRESAELLAEDSLGGAFIDAPEEAPAWSRGGLLMERDGVVDPVAACSALARCAPAASICEQVTVRALHSSAASVRVDTSAGEVVAGEVVVAANAWTAALIPGMPIAPVRAQMLASAAVTPSPPTGRPVYAHRGHRYWRRLDSGELLAGGCRELAAADEQTDADEPTPAVQGHLDAFVAGLLGAPAEITHRWAGTMGFTPDGLPLVGPVPGMPRVWVCGGFTGHGLGMAAAAARAIADRLCGGAPPPVWLAPSRLAPAMPDATGPGSHLREPGP